jgi:hypothetical protein
VGASVIKDLLDGALDTTNPIFGIVLIAFWGFVLSYVALARKEVPE